MMKEIVLKSVKPEEYGDEVVTCRVIENEDINAYIATIPEERRVIATKVAPVEAKPEPTFTPYIVRIDTDVLNVRACAGTGYKINTQVKRHGLYTIVAEDGVWCKLKSGAGWINLNYTQKIK